MEENDRYARYTRMDGDGPELGLLVESLIEDAKGYFEAQRDLAGLQASEKAGRAVAVLVLALVVAVLLGGVLVMLSVALALWLGALLGDLALGFVATGGIHLLLTGLFWLLWRTALREKITLAIINAAHGTD
jgi:hypothetical protein